MAEEEVKAPREFESFYNAELMPILRELESERKSIKSTLLYPTIGIGTLALGLIAIIPQLGLQALVLSGVAGVGAYTWFKTKASREYRADFKNKVIRAILKNIDTEGEMRYSGYGRIKRNEFVNCGIVNKNPDRYQGDDLVSGKIDQTEFSFSEIHAQYYVKDSKGRRRLQTLFKGLVFKADFNKDFQGRTVMVPDIAERFLGNMGQQLQKLNFGRGELVQLESVEFEKLFAVYSTDQVEARYILTPKFMERVVKFCEKNELKISMAFHNSNVYVGIPMSKDFFEPTIFRTLLDYERTKEYHDDMTLAISLVEELDLNNRIWSKMPDAEEEKGTPPGTSRGRRAGRIRR